MKFKFGDLDRVQLMIINYKIITGNFNFVIFSKSLNS